jgi:hypothetical protein
VDMADRIVAVVPPPIAPTVHAIRHAPESSTLAQRVEELTKQLQDHSRPATTPRYAELLPPAYTTRRIYTSSIQRTPSRTRDQKLHSNFVDPSTSSEFRSL